MRERARVNCLSVCVAHQHGCSSVGRSRATACALLGAARLALLLNAAHMIDRGRPLMAEDAEDSAAAPSFSLALQRARCGARRATITFYFACIHSSPHALARREFLLLDPATRKPYPYWGLFAPTDEFRRLGQDAVIYMRMLQECLFLAAVGSIIYAWPMAINWQSVRGYDMSLWGSFAIGAGEKVTWQHVILDSMRRAASGAPPRRLLAILRAALCVARHRAAPRPPRALAQLGASVFPSAAFRSPHDPALLLLRPPPASSHHRLRQGERNPPRVAPGNRCRRAAERPQSHRPSTDSDVDVSARLP
ncbi:hypothetical protein OAO87_04450 [bacterium]|nr:hypothetical protein [bacterium]